MYFAVTFRRADCVYCVTALIGEKKKDEKNKHK